MLANLFSNLLSNPLTIATALSPFIVNRINRKRAELSAKAKYEEEELNQAHKIADEICINAGSIVHFNEEAIYGIIYRGLNTNSLNSNDSENRGWNNQDLQSWSTYREKIQEWNTLRTKRRVEVEVYFGENTRKIFDRTMYLIEYIERIINAAFYSRSDSNYFIDSKQLNEDEISQYNISIESLIKLFNIESDDSELANLLRKHVNEETDLDSSSDEKTFTTDIRYKYRPIYYYLKDIELFNLRKAMMRAMQKQDVSTLRMQQQFRPIKSG